MCGKVKFTKVEAVSALNHAKKKGKKYRREKRIYHCEKCNKWHLTSIEEFGVKEVKLIEPERWERLLGD